MKTRRKKEERIHKKNNECGERSKKKRWKRRKNETKMKAEKNIKRKKSDV